VVNFRDNRMLRVDPTGAVAPFVTVSRKGLAHVCFKRDNESSTSLPRRAWCG
jgi:hypothetical protein